MRLQENLINREKKDFFIFFALNSFLFSNLICIWLFWFSKYICNYNVDWSLAFQTNFTLTITIALLFHFFPKLLVSFHTIWNLIKNNKLIIYIFNLYSQHPKTCFFLLAGLVFSYCRLEFLTLSNHWSLISFLIALLALVRI